MRYPRPAIPLCAWLLWSASAWAEEPVVADPVELARQLVQQLGADSYSDRLQARERLVRLGRPAIEPLEWAAQSEDSEIRLRAAEILIALRGRGFLGIGLNEEPAPTDEDADEDAPQFVRAIQVLDFKSYSHLGVRRPFPAETAGIQVGDKILEVNGRAVHGIKDLMREVILIGPARMACLMIERDGKPLRIVLRLTRNPMAAISSGFGVEPIQDQGPPVDLEKELNLDDKPAATTEKEAGVAAVTDSAEEEPIKNDK